MKELNGSWKNVRFPYLLNTILLKYKLLPFSILFSTFLARIYHFPVGPFCATTLIASAIIGVQGQKLICTRLNLFILKLVFHVHCREDSPELCRNWSAWNWLVLQFLRTHLQRLCKGSNLNWLCTFYMLERSAGAGIRRHRLDCSFALLGFKKL